jgi:hypothetical protein
MQQWLNVLWSTLTVTLAVVLFRHFWSAPCPRCHARKICRVGGCTYSCRDVWGYQGGRYSVHRCRGCGLCLVRHRFGEQEIAANDWADASHRLVLGRGADE